MIPAVTPRKQMQGASLHLARRIQKFAEPRLVQLKWNRCRKLVLVCFVAFCGIRIR